MKEILKEHTILYAEDNPSVQKHTSEYLQRYFTRVFMANDGKEALKMYAEHHPDVLLLDIDMPKVDGLSVAAQIREGNVDIPIVMLTAFTDTALLLKATELNLCKYLVKPVDSKVFKEVLQKIAKQLKRVEGKTIHLTQGYHWETDKGVLYKKDTRIPLLEKEKKLFSLLIKNRGHSVSFEEIMAVVWEDDFEAEISIESVKFQVSQLRKKLPQDTIQNIYAKGYKLG